MSGWVVMDDGIIIFLLSCSVVYFKDALPGMQPAAGVVALWNLWKGAVTLFTHSNSSYKHTSDNTLFRVTPLLEWWRQMTLGTTFFFSHFSVVMYGTVSPNGAPSLNVININAPWNLNGLLFLWEVWILK